MNAENFNLNKFAIDSAGWPVELAPGMLKEKARTKEAPRVLLIDDDPLFCKTLTRKAGEKHLPLTTCTSVQEMEAYRQYDRYDVILLDYYLGETTARDIIPLFKSKVPIIVISGSDNAKLETTPWPQEVKSIVEKKEGMPAILNEVSRILNIKSSFLKDRQATQVPYLAASMALLLSTAAIVGLIGSIFLLSLSGLLNFRKSEITDPAFYYEAPSLSFPIKWDQAPIDKTQNFG